LFLLGILEDFGERQDFLSELSIGCYRDKAVWAGRMRELNP
jgi:hypothetical protein